MPQSLWPWMLFPKSLRSRKIVLVLAFPTAALIFLLIHSPSGYIRPLVQRYADTSILKQAQRRLAAAHSGVSSGRRNFTIHVWNHGERMKRRFLRSYGDIERDPFQFCAVRNCELSIDDSRYNESDAVLFHLHQTKGPHALPPIHPQHQVWIFFTDESPLHTFLVSREYSMRDYNGIFNWSMTYRSDSDIPVPYGTTRALTALEKESMGPLPNYSRLKTKGIAIMGSNCGGKNYRWDYLEELQNHIQVDVYGRCGPFKCPGHFMRDCPLINKYKFYLAFENSNCHEYITEKMWWNAYEKEAVPVVMGATRDDYERLCPPNSFIHVDDFESPADLADHLENLMKNDTAYNEYFEWKKSYKVINENGYFGSLSLHLCHMCGALNNKTNLLPKVYTDLDRFWSAERDCSEAVWQPS